ncbi:hypothetical protein [Dapis sp. BLCC M229]|uniref:hypothetical protein n=1 Tax=Dapis sp. BLCC M229 TaxID=3400188 RepID=UPI003CF4B55B
MITLNPDGKFDWYRFLDVDTTASGISIPIKLTVKEIPEFIPYAIVTRDGKWHEQGSQSHIRLFLTILPNLSTMNLVNSPKQYSMYKIRKI